MSHLVAEGLNAVMVEGTGSAQSVVVVECHEEHVGRVEQLVRD